MPRFCRSTPAPTKSRSRRSQEVCWPATRNVPARAPARARTGPREGSGWGWGSGWFFGVTTFSSLERGLHLPGLAAVLERELPTAADPARAAQLAADVLTAGAPALVPI